ncbi:Ovule protein [Caenorhabditis elegans]|uniref:Ovule protein n=1 Tax=Caenorhabditis elegans TaxID=6239 RepID=O62402_CAEEL|nr:Ovule protein [Caenorhabditis elegans]CAA16289.2 Ovule protein [Caenorhabditis elegans]|eukprot:NP_503055.2 Uncharacterized protein CELE_Y116A8B.4 [Caenorhabditis elegans]
MQSEKEAPYFGMYGNNYLSPRYIVTSPTPTCLVESGHPEYSNSTFNSPGSSNESQRPNYYQIQPPSPGEMVIVRTTTVTRNTTSITPVSSTF